MIAPVTAFGEGSGLGAEGAPPPRFIGLSDARRRLARALIAWSPEQAGMIVLGPPESGKRRLCQATAGDLGLPIFTLRAGDAGEVSDAAAHRVFAAARALGQAMLVIPRLEALGLPGERPPALARLFNQLLAEIDGIAGANAGLRLVGTATEAAWIDPALLRPGRLQPGLVMIPDLPMRAMLLELGLAPAASREIDPKRLAARTDGYSGADLRRVCARAAELAGPGHRIEVEHVERALRLTAPEGWAWLERQRGVMAACGQTEI